MREVGVKIIIIGAGTFLTVVPKVSALR